jgi:hypothetical protein
MNRVGALPEMPGSANQEAPLRVSRSGFQALSPSVRFHYHPQGQDTDDNQKEDERDSQKKRGAQFGNHDVPPPRLSENSLNQKNLSGTDFGAGPHPDGSSQTSEYDAFNHTPLLPLYRLRFS